MYMYVKGVLHHTLHRAVNWLLILGRLPFPRAP
jgi:hypothetical protein